jgi:hypothetical protein
MIKELIKLANELDQRGFQKEADALDKIIKEALWRDPMRGMDPRTGKPYVKKKKTENEMREYFGSMSKEEEAQAIAEYKSKQQTGGSVTTGLKDAQNVAKNEALSRMINEGKEDSDPEDCEGDDCPDE